MSEEKELPVYAVKDNRTLNLRLAGRTVVSKSGVLSFETENEVREFEAALAKNISLARQVTKIDREAALKQVAEFKANLRAMAHRGVSSSAVNAELAHETLKARDEMLAKTGVNLNDPAIKESVRTELTEIGKGVNSAKGAAAAMAAMNKAQK